MIAREPMGDGEEEGWEVKGDLAADKAPAPPRPPHRRARTAARRCVGSLSSPEALDRAGEAHASAAILSRVVEPEG